MKTTLRLIEEWTGHRKQSGAINGLVCLLLFLALMAAVIVLGSCANPPRARIIYHGQYGDYSYSAKSGFEANLKNVITRKIEITTDK